MILLTTFDKVYTVEGLWSIMKEEKSIDIIKFFSLDSSVEHEALECKVAKGGLPKSLWDTYSSFANTDGGIILLGVQEKPQGIFSITGIDKPFEMVNDFWSSCSNATTISRNILSNSDVQILTDISGCKVIMISVPAAQATLRPIFIRGNIENTFIRHGESDVKATSEELSALIRNSQNMADSHILIDFSLEDLDEDSVSSFKSVVATRFKDKEYEKKSNEEFLIELGFYGKDRKTHCTFPKEGCLLFFGKYNSIKDVFPSFHLDFFDYRNSTSRWSDRVASDMPNSREMNIFNFFNIIYDKLIASDTNPFKLDERQMRIEHPPLIAALRESLVNMLAHADYRSSGVSLKVEIHDDHYLFRNPGKMLVSIDEYETGGVSTCRNEIIMKAFRYMGFAERQGMGGKEIMSVAINNKLMIPTIKTNLMYTELKFWKIDAASYPDLSLDEQSILRFILNTIKPVPISLIKEKHPQYSDYMIRKILATLIQKKRIVSIGNGKSTRYSINPTSTELRWTLQKVIAQLIDMV